MEETTQTNPQYTLPGSTPKPTAPWLRPFLLGLAAVMLVVAAAFYLIQREPADTQAFVYVETSPVGEVAKLLDGDTLVAPEFAGEGIVAEYVDRGDSGVALVRTLAATSTEADIYRAFDMDLYTIGTEVRRLTTDGARKGQVALSSDGTQAAYAYVESENPLANDNPRFADWKVAVLTIATGELREVGSGTAPAFIDSDAGRAVLYATEEGLAVFSLSSGSTASYIAPEFTEAYASLEVAPDGRHFLVRDSGTEQHAVYAIESALPSLEVALVGYVPSLIAPTLTHERVYGLSVSGTGAAEVRSYPLENLNTESRLVRALPDGGSVIRLIPHY